MVRWCWVNFQCPGVLLMWIIEQGPIEFAVSAGGVVWPFFSFVYHFSVLSLSLWETARYGLKYCLKGPLNPKQPINQMKSHHIGIHMATSFNSLNFKYPCWNGGASLPSWWPLFHNVAYIVIFLLTHSIANTSLL